MNANKKAFSIAKKSLRDCYVDGKIVASPTHFSDYWGRDAFYALKGSILLGDYNIARNVINMFLKYQRPYGDVPLKILREYELPKYLFKKKISRKKLAPRYNFILNFLSVNENSLLIISAREYLDASGDLDYIKEIYPKLRKTIKWYHTMCQVNDVFLSNWMDTIVKVGPVLYSNVLHYKALVDFAYIENAIGYTDGGAKYEEFARIKKLKIFEDFWLGDYFKDEHYNRSKRFDCAGNLLACYYGLTTKAQTKKILNKYYSIRDKPDEMIPVQDIKYPFYKVSPLAHIMGMSDYQNGTCWLWVNLIAVQVQATIDKEKAKKEMNLIVKNIVIRDNEIGETYNRDWTPYERRFWKNATPFAWSAGIFMETINILYEFK